MEGNEGSQSPFSETSTRSASFSTLCLMIVFAFCLWLGMSSCGNQGGSAAAAALVVGLNEAQISLGWVGPAVSRSVQPPSEEQEGFRRRRFFVARFERPAVVACPGGWRRSGGGDPSVAGHCRCWLLREESTRRAISSLLACDSASSCQNER